MQNFEKLGALYLGKTVNFTTGQLEKNLLFYESKNLTTHAVCVGMTGSGKTGLGIVILEEAAIDKIPAIIIDPKGDLTNLLLTFPNLSPEEFAPWIDQEEADRKGMTPQQYSEYIAKFWTEGLSSWGEGSDRIKQLRKTVDLAIYTPASRAGIPISILSSFAAPTKDQLLDTSAVREKVLTVTSSLLGLLGIDTDPIKSREHILLSNIIQQAWQKGVNLDIAALIQQVQQPSFTKIGALEVDTFYPPKDRMSLSISLNNLLASPGFQAWMEGVPLDVKQLLYTSEGKPRLAVISIAHLSDAERMFFVTLLLNEFVSWMRRQSGTSSLRALLYMDEIFGFFPPTATPPSKLPMITLLKQARAYGVGIVLTTQNPVDLDYKGLSNCGTWFIGKLQTERDKARVIEGLKIASNGDVNADDLDQMIAQTGKRTFIMRSVYEKEPILFQTRWTLSYLRGPLTLSQIATLTDRSQDDIQETNAASIPDFKASSETKPNVPSGISEFFVFQDSQPAHFEPRVVGLAKIHFVDSKSRLDVWQDVSFVVHAGDDGKSVRWDEGIDIPNLKEMLKKDSIPGSTYGELPRGLLQEKNYQSFSKDFAAALYQNQSYTLFQTSNPKMKSLVGESEADFRIRVAQELLKNRDEMVKKLREKYAGKIASLSDSVQRAEEKIVRKQEQAGRTKLSTIIDFGSAVVGALFGRGITKGTISQTGTSIRRATQIGKDSTNIAQAEQDLQNYQQQLQDMQAQLNSEITALTAKGADDIKLESTEIRPRKSDITVERIALVWWAV